jgi:hypothetical protein
MAGRFSISPRSRVTTSFAPTSGRSSFDRSAKDPRGDPSVWNLYQTPCLFARRDVTLSPVSRL